MKPTRDTGRSFGELLQYAMITVAGLAFAAWGAAYVAHMVTASFHSTAALLPH